MKPSYAQLKLAVAAGLLLATVPSAYAAPGTSADTTVTNTVDVDYSVGGVAQTTIQATSDFKVDRKVDLIVTNDDGAAVDVVPNSTDNVLTFTVTNETNDTIDIRLVVAPQPVGGTAVYGGTDNIDVDNIALWLEDGTTAGFQDTEDTAITFLDEVPAGASNVVYVVGDIAASAANGDVASVRLLAVAAGDVTTDVDGAYTATNGTLAADLAETNTGSADNATFVDTVFADTSTADGNTDEDGQQFARGQFDVVTASITVTKSSTVADDPINGATNPKAIPGATIEYCIDVNNTGSVAAGSISIADVIPANTTYVAGSIKSAATGTGTACDLGSGTTEDDNNAGADETDTDGGNFDGVDTVTVTTPSIGASSRFKATFQVTVD
jgi:uncharacterized repeat protein (TIGR01451 family)